MAELKTKETNQPATDFLETIIPEEKRKDGYALLDLFTKVTGEKARMWGTSIVGLENIIISLREVYKKETGH